MATIDLITREQPTDWSYDSEADVLYISFGKPRVAIGEDVGDGVIIRYDEQTGQVVGITIIGLRARLERKETTDD